MVAYHVEFSYQDFGSQGSYPCLTPNAPVKVRRTTAVDFKHLLD